MSFYYWKLHNRIKEGQKKRYVTITLIVIRGRGGKRESYIYVIRVCVV